MGEAFGISPFKAARKKPGELLDRADTNRSEERDTLSRDLGLAVGEYLATTGEHFHDAFHPIRQARNFSALAPPRSRAAVTRRCRRCDRRQARRRQAQGGASGQGKATPAAKRKAAPAAKGKATPAAKGKATPAAKGKATPAAKGKAAPDSARRRRRPGKATPAARARRRRRPKAPARRPRTAKRPGRESTGAKAEAGGSRGRGQGSEARKKPSDPPLRVLDGLARPRSPCPTRRRPSSSAEPAASLSVAWQPPFLDGGATISAYRVEIDSSAGFDFHGDDYRVDEVAFVHEVQTVTTHFRAAESQRQGTFTLSWGGKTTAHLDHDASADEVADAVSRLTGVWDVGVPPVRVSGRAQQRRVARPTVQVDALSTVSGSFKLSFEGQETASIAVDASAIEFKYALEALDTIFTASVVARTTSRPRGPASGRSPTHQAHTLTQGAQDASLMVSDTADLSPSSTAEVVITERIKGADAFRYARRPRRGARTARVTAYNSAGYGP
ncbi:serine/threonine kinase [Aureococcus anophagefferens]|nr:serine/threonine kinase [Aureococcus anophagefferens]